MPFPCKKVWNLSVENGSAYDSRLLIADSLKPKLELVFEQQFDDSVYLVVDRKILEVRKIQTNRAMGVCLETLTVDYSAFKKVPKVSLLLKEKGVCFSFYPVRGKQFLYINFINGHWFAELSNVQRGYR